MVIPHLLPGSPTCYLYTRRHASNPIPASGAQDLGTAGCQVLKTWMVYNDLSWIIQ